MKKLLVCCSLIILTLIIVIGFSEKDMGSSVSMNLEANNGGNLAISEDNMGDKKGIGNVILNLKYDLQKAVNKFQSENNPMVGIYLKSKSGNNLIIDENNGPIVMGNETGKEDTFDDLKSGDKIEITCGPIRETYPGGTEIYSCKLIERGSADDIPKDVLDKLQEMNWEFDL